MGSRLRRRLRRLRLRRTATAAMATVRTAATAAIGYYGGFAYSAGTTIIIIPAPASMCTTAIAAHGRGTTASGPTGPQPAARSDERPAPGRTTVSTNWTGFNRRQQQVQTREARQQRFQTARTRQHSAATTAGRQSGWTAPDEDDRGEGHHRLAVLIGDGRVRAERAHLGPAARRRLLDDLAADVQRVARDRRACASGARRSRASRGRPGGARRRSGR